MTFSQFLKIVAFLSSVLEAIVGSDSWQIPMDTLCFLQQAHSDTFVWPINKHSHFVLLSLSAEETLLPQNQCNSTSRETKLHPSEF